MTILELRELRNKVWEGAKAFVETDEIRMVCFLLRTQLPMPRWKRK